MDSAVSNSIPKVGREYRLSRQTAEIGVMEIMSSIVLGVFLVTIALSNAPGAFLSPVAFAVAFGIFSCCFTLLGLWLVAIYLRHRLFVAPTTVRLTGCFATRQLSLAGVTHVTWKSSIKDG